MNLDKVKDTKFWLKVLHYILELILEGNDKSKAFISASTKFNIPVDIIKKSIGKYIK